MWGYQHFSTHHRPLEAINWATARERTSPWQGPHILKNTLRNSSPKTETVWILFRQINSISCSEWGLINHEKNEISGHYLMIIFPFQGQLKTESLIKWIELQNQFSLICKRIILTEEWPKYLLKAHLLCLLKNKCHTSREWCRGGDILVDTINR